MTGEPKLRIVPLSFRAACAFIEQHHRHHKPPRGMKFAIGVMRGGELVGVATAGRPVSRHYEAEKVIEVNRTCTDGTPNANSMLYGAVRRVAVAMGYKLVITYIQQGETGASMRAAGFRRDKSLPPRKSWSQSSLKLRSIRDPVGTGGVARERWVWP
jgi:hypothetical protein